MRKIKSNFFISSMASSSRPTSGTSRDADDEMGAAVGAAYATADALLMGRVLYDESGPRTGLSMPTSRSATS